METERLSSLDRGDCDRPTRRNGINLKNSQIIYHNNKQTTMWSIPTNRKIIRSGQKMMRPEMFNSRVRDAARVRHTYCTLTPI